MWSKRTRAARAPLQEPQMPAFGQDSTYGVRSVSEWGGDSAVVGSPGVDIAKATTDETAETLENAAEVSESVLAAPNPQGSLSASSGAIDARDSPFLSSPSVSLPDDPATPPEELRPVPPPSPISTAEALPPSLQSPIHAQAAVPPSPEETVHPLATPLPPSPALLFPATFSPSNAHYPYSSDAETDNSSLALSLSSLPDLHFGLGASEPSSPASYTSMPSYVASVSSMSRNSSPLGSAVDVPGSSRRLRNAMGEGMGVGLASLVASRTEDPLANMGGSADMVLPTLSLPESSLHLSLPRWTGGRGGIRVALLTNDKRHTRSIITSMEAQGETVVAVGHAEVGVVRDGKLALTLITDHSPDQIAARIKTVYATLHALLNPATPSTEESLNGLIEGYIAKSDWVHVIFELGPIPKGSRDALKALCPLVSPQPGSSANPSPVASPPPALAVTSPALDALDGPTPMPAAQALEPSGYFSRDSLPPPAPWADVHSAQALLLLGLMDTAPIHTRVSIRKFLSWRPAPLDSSSSSLDTAPSAASHSASASGEASGSGASHSHPIPTVARASGSGEWEANLSRRIAKRKEGESGGGSTICHTRGRRPRRRSGQSADRGGIKRHEMPLFPRRLSASKSSHRAPATALGLAGLVEKTFRPLRELIETRWGKVAVVALAVAVGLGFWASSRR